MTHNHQCLTKPDRDPVTYVAPQSEAAGLTLLELNAAAGVRAEVA